LKNKKKRDWLEKNWKTIPIKAKNMYNLSRRDTIKLSEKSDLNPENS